MTTDLDTLVIGAGPIGLETALALRAAGQRVRTLEAGPLGASIAQWPPGTRFLSAPERVAIGGAPVPSVREEPPTRESYLAYLRALVEAHELDVWCHATVEQIDVDADGVTVTTGDRHPATHRAAHVVLATGRLSTPRRLDAPGAEQAHVHHRVRDPHWYHGQRVVVIGDGNGALTTAARLWRAGSDVAIVHRSADLDDGFNRDEVLADVRMLIDKGCLAAHAAREVCAIGAHDVTLRAVEGTDAADETIGADFVVAEIGFETDDALLRAVGVTTDDDGVPHHDVATMRTNVPRVFVAGTIAAASNDRTAISHGHAHVVAIVRALTGEAAVVGGARGRRYAFEPGDDQVGGG